jgi:hypothetical protein
MGLRLLLTAIFLSLALLFSTAFAEDKNFQFKKQTEIQQVKPKKSVKIKLKRLAEGKYTWDLSGDDVDEIIKADKRLKKLLKIE